MYKKKDVVKVLYFAQVVMIVLNVIEKQMRSFTY